MSTIKQNCQHKAALKWSPQDLDEKLTDAYKGNRAKQKIRHTLENKSSARITAEKVQQKRTKQLLVPVVEESLLEELVQFLLFQCTRLENIF